MLTYSQDLAHQYLQKVSGMLSQVKLGEAMSLLQCALDLDESDETKRVGQTLKEQIDEQLKLTEHEKQSQIEMRIATIKAEITNAEEQAKKVRSEEEADTLKEQMEGLHKQEEQLKERLRELESRQRAIEEREVLLSDQTEQLEKLLSQLAATTTEDVTALQQQMSNITAGDKDLDAARRRFASLQKVAMEAQHKLKVEESRQRERNELMQKQIEFFTRKGMSPSQLSFRNYLKDVKRLSLLRKDYAPFPLRCFISYAWETDTIANKELQSRLQKLKDELKVAGMDVTLDIRDMRDDMKKFMVQGIDNSHKVLLICTPRLKVRAADTTTNNLQLVWIRDRGKREKDEEFKRLIRIVTGACYSGGEGQGCP